MDLGDVQANDGDEESRPFVPTPTPHLKIKRKPISSSSIELTSLGSSQTQLRETGYGEILGPFSIDKTRQKRSWKDRFGKLGRRNGSQTPNRPAWFTTVSGGLILAIVVLLVNISVLAWSYSRFEVKNNTAVLFTGSCARTSTITAAADLAVNILSTLLLAASNNCGQLLLSPTRSEVDRAHGQGVWLNIGIASVRNWKWIGKWRIAMWGVLFLSSVPLHLLYNSVVYSSSYTNDYMAAAVTENFLAGGFWNQTIALHSFTVSSIPGYNDGVPQPYISILSSMQKNISALTKLTNSECRSAFGTANLQSPYLNVVLVTNYTASDSFIQGVLHYPEWETNFMPWFNDTSSAAFMPGGAVSCGEWDYGTGANWSIPVCNFTASEEAAVPAHVQECLAQPAGEFDDQCSISISLTLLIAVIVCNAFKAVCLIGTLMARTFHPLATVGDAVASFLERPDETTRGCGPLSLNSVTKISSKPVPYYEKIRTWKMAYVWRGKRRNWGHALSSSFSSFGMLLLFAGWFATMVQLSRSWTGDIVASWSHDVTYTSYTNIAAISLGQPNPTSLTGNVLLVNTPQLAISLIYVFYNSILTRMLIAREISLFGTTRRSLRVSRPTGAQRSTYWLQLPYRYIIPSMSAMALLHFFISRGIYLVNIKVYNISGEEVPNRDHFAHATSGLALLLAFLVGTIMLFALLGMIFRKLGDGIPILGTNSVAISSACHPVVGDEDSATRRLLYGIVGGPAVDEVEEGYGEKKHVCFCSFEVEPLADGERYY